MAGAVRFFLLPAHRAGILALSPLLALAIVATAPALAQLQVRSSYTVNVVGDGTVQPTVVSPDFNIRPTCGPLGESLTCTGNPPVGATVNFTATPNSSAVVFLGWSGVDTCPGTGPCKLAIGFVGPVLTATFGPASSAQNIAPDSGYWWNPAEGGRGFTLEYASGKLFMATFLYDQSGRSSWYGAGPLPLTGNTFSAALATYSGGQTLTGAYKPAVGGASAGTITIVFSDSTHGTLTWPGGTIPIQRYEFASNGLASPPASTQPQTGWWWNPSEGGRGFFVELQANQAFVATYMYDSAGNPLWYASGPGALANNAYQGTWTSYTGGQTMTGGYRPPAQTADAGSLTIQFSSSTTGTLTLPDGRQIPLQRYGF